MSESDYDRLLRALADVDEPTPAWVPDDDQLRRYRAGGLDEDESTRVELALGRSAAARERLAALGGVDLAKPSPATRARVLATLEPSRGATRVTPRPTPRRAWWQAVAAAAAVVLTIGYCYLPERGLPDTLRYVAEVRGLEVSRGATVSDRADEATARAVPDTLLRLTLTAVENGSSEVAYGLYRQSGSRLERVAEAEGLRLETGPGGAEFQIPAARLVGERPGSHRIFLVAARPGNLPDRLTLASGADPLVVLAEDGRRRVQSVRIELQEPASPASLTP